MNKKLILCLLLAVLLLPAGCGSRPGNTKPDAPSPQESLANAAGVWLATAAGITETDCSIGKPLAAFRLTDAGIEPIDYQLFPVFAGGTIAALATGTVNDGGEYIAGCNAEFPAELQACFEQTPDAAFAIVYAEEGAFCLRETDDPVPLRRYPVPGCASIETLDAHRQNLSFSPIQKDFAFTPPALPPMPAG